MIREKRGDGEVKEKESGGKGRKTKLTIIMNMYRGPCNGRLEWMSSFLEVIREDGIKTNTLFFISPSMPNKVTIFFLSSLFFFVFLSFLSPLSYSTNKLGRIVAPKCPPFVSIGVGDCTGILSSNHILSSFFPLYVSLPLLPPYLISPSFHLSLPLSLLFLFFLYILFLSLHSYI